MKETILTSRGQVSTIKPAISDDFYLENLKTKPSIWFTCILNPPDQFNCYKLLATWPWQLETSPSVPLQRVPKAEFVITRADNTAAPSTARLVSP